MSLTSLPQVDRTATRWGWVANASINVGMTTVPTAIDLTNQGSVFRDHPDLTLNGDRVDVNESGWYRVHGLIYIRLTGTEVLGQHLQWNCTVRSSADRLHSFMGGPVPKYGDITMTQPISTGQLYFLRQDRIRIELSVIHGDLTNYAVALRQSTRLEIERIH